MKHVLNSVRLRSGARAQIARIESDLDIAPTQQTAWRTFAATYDEVREAVETVDAMTRQQLDEQAPTLRDALETRSRRLAVRLGAARELSEAAANLYHALTPPQQRRADKVLPVLVRELCGADERIPQQVMMLSS